MEIRKLKLILKLFTLSDFFHQMKTFAKSLDPDQAQQKVRPGLDPNC